MEKKYFICVQKCILHHKLPFQMTKCNDNKEKFKSSSTNKMYYYNLATEN